MNLLFKNDTKAPKSPWKFFLISSPIWLLGKSPQSLVTSMHGFSILSRISKITATALPFECIMSSWVKNTSCKIYKKHVKTYKKSKFVQQNYVIHVSQSDVFVDCFVGNHSFACELQFWSICHVKSFNDLVFRCRRIETSWFWKTIIWIVEDIMSSNDCKSVPLILSVVVFFTIKYCVFQKNV